MNKYKVAIFSDFETDFSEIELMSFIVRVLEQLRSASNAEVLVISKEGSVRGISP